MAFFTTPLNIFMIEILFLIIGLVVGLALGYFIKKSKGEIQTIIAPAAPVDLSLFNNLSTQLAEIKVKFTEVEKSRDRLDIEKEARLKDFIESNKRYFEELKQSSSKVDGEKENRFKDFIENNRNLFEELKYSADKSDIEKEKRIQEIIESNKNFFEEQKIATEKFLEGQGQSREQIESQRDAQITDMRNLIEKFTQAISGTKKRGNVGESILADVLSNSIRAGVVEKDLRIASKCVEFAWNLGDGKYIPIDSKLPDIFAAYQEYLDCADIDKAYYKKRIRDKVRKNIEEIQKYQHQSNTIDSCILVVPPAIIEVCPEVVGDGRDEHVFICTYTDVFPVAHILQEQYIRMKEEGDIGKYKKLVEQLFGVLDKVMAKTETIDRAITMLNNANTEIKSEVVRSKESTSILQKTTTLSLSSEVL